MNSSSRGRLAGLVVAFAVLASVLWTPPALARPAPAAERPSSLVAVSCCHWREGSWATSDNGRWVMLDRKLYDVQRGTRSRDLKLPGFGGDRIVLDDGRVVSATVTTYANDNKTAYFIANARRGPKAKRTPLSCGSVAPGCGRVRDVSNDARYLVAQKGERLYLVDQQTGATTVLSDDPTSADDYFRASFSGTGSLLIVQGSDPQPSRTFVHDLATGTQRVLDPASGGSTWCGEISNDGRLVTFVTDRSLAPEDPPYTDEYGPDSLDLYQLDLSTGATAWITRPTGDLGATDSSRVFFEWGCPDASADGRYVAFEGFPNQLDLSLPKPRNETQVLRWSRDTGRLTQATVNPRGRGATRDLVVVGIRGGRDVLFLCFDEKLVPIHRSKLKQAWLFRWRDGQPG